MRDSLETFKNKDNEVVLVKKFEQVYEFYNHNWTSHYS